MCVRFLHSRRPTGTFPMKLHVFFFSLRLLLPLVASLRTSYGSVAICFQCRIKRRLYCAKLAINTIHKCVAAAAAVHIRKNKYMRIGSLLFVRRNVLFSRRTSKQPGGEGMYRDGNDAKRRRLPTIIFA